MCFRKRAKPETRAEPLRIFCFLERDPDLFVFIITGNKGLRLCDFIASRCARRTGEDPLLAAHYRGAIVALPGGPSARWHKPQLALAVKIDRRLTASRGPRSCSRNMRKKLCRAFFGLRQRSNRAYGGARRRTVDNSTSPPAFIKRFKPTCRPNDTIESLVRAAEI